MPNAKRFLITSETNEVIIFRRVTGEASEGKCPLCGAEVTGLPATVEKTVSALPPATEGADDLNKTTSEEEKQK